MTVSEHDCRMTYDSEYREGYAYGIDHDFVYSLFSVNNLMAMSLIYSSYAMSYHDGLAYYCREQVFIRERGAEVRILCYADSLENIHGGINNEFKNREFADRKL